MIAKSNPGINFKRIALATSAILLIPLLGRWPWSLADFVIMGVMLFITGLSLDVAVRKVKREHRIIAVIAIIGVFLLIWARLALSD